ncbi:MAG: DUF3024 domain-containing protein [Natronospirillum sp.]|uniref:DUF3024 domain-containing protein n=1 Tax=Natronospirillum sp. TaxID=2812955 RepID=UPI0025D6B774|nr:DUF3024 domain-containing protein [Natronospirillum sp.]MCH8550624.1 DUF3024 domain-containing protein [Natronospirillum sp.]
MIENGDFKRISHRPSEFEQRRIEQVVQEFLTSVVPQHYRGPGEVRQQVRERTIEFYEAQPHPVHADRLVRLPVALIKGASDGLWTLYFRGSSGHWVAYPEGSGLRLGSVLSLIEQDEQGVFW